MATKRKTKTKYQRLLAAKRSLCSGRGTAASFKKAAKAYCADAVKKGNKTKAQAEATVKRVKGKSCAVKTATKKRKTTRKATY